MRLILGIVFAAAIVAPVSAADMRMPMKAPSYAPAFSWTGTYVGANVGGVRGAVGAPGVMDIHNGNVIGGFQAGYNWQIGQYVVGIEQDYQFTGLKQTATFAAPAGLFRAGDQLAVKTDYLAATRAKLGMTWDRALIYAAGGLETGEFDVASSYVARGVGGSPAIGFTDSNKLHFGFNVGAGVDYAVTNNVFIGLEYRYLDLGKETYNLGAFTPVGGGTAQTVGSSVDLKASEVTARLNFKLGGLGLFGM
jgi:outer membrane immunogenic protein